MQLRCKLSRAVHSLSLAAAEVVLLAPVENDPASCLLSLYDHNDSSFDIRAWIQR